MADFGLSPGGAGLAQQPPAGGQRDPGVEACEQDDIDQEPPGLNPAPS